MKIVTDSSCDIRHIDCINFERVPLTIRIGNEDYVDNDDLDIENLVNIMGDFESGTACPSPQAWYDAARDDDEIFFVTLTSNMSGSHNSAIIAKDMLEDDGKKVFVLDTLSASSGVVLVVEKIEELIKQNKSFKEICEIISNYKFKLNFILFSIDNFVRNGRVNKIIGTTINTIGISLIGEASFDGKLKPLHKAKGIKKSINYIIQEMKDNGYNGGKIIISHCFNLEDVEKLASKIKEIFGDVFIEILETSGLCSYYAEKKGIIISYEI